MRRWLVWLLSGMFLVLTALAGTAVALPGTRHLVSALWNAPDRLLPALTENDLIHYEPGAEAYAREVSNLLPAALSRVEAAQGRPFAHPIILGVYKTPEAYAAANASGNPGAVGVTAFGRSLLSPTLFGPQRRRLPGILAHELSHAHIMGWVSIHSWVRLPVWFKEGLAVMVSGAGAEFVGEQEAIAAIRRGESITIEDTGSYRNLSEIRFDRASPQMTWSHRTVMAYRQAAMLVTWLHHVDQPGFHRMMDAILDGQAFPDAVELGYGRDLPSLWQRFSSELEGSSG